MKRKKILQFVGSLKVGGKQTVALNYHKYSTNNEFEYHYIVYGNEIGALETEAELLGGKIIRVNVSKKNYFGLVRCIRQIIKKYGPYDVIHSHPLFNSGFILKAAWKEHVPIRIAHGHSARFKEKSSLIRKIYIRIMRSKIRKYSTYVLACSKEAGDYLCGEKWFSKHGVIINNGIDSKAYIHDEEKRNNIRRELGVDGKFVVGHVGRMSEEKNQDFILDVFKKVTDENPNSRLLLIGDGSIKYQLKTQAKKLGIENNVLFLGERKDINYLLQGMDVFLFPSKHEGLGIALIEAQASGLQCIVSDSIPRKAEITNLIDRLPLSMDKTFWARQLLKYNNDYTRVNTQDKIISSGYDVRSITKKIDRLYN